MANNKLELTWIGKDKQPKLEPRILIEDPDKSYGDRNTENMLIFGDNLLALKALEQEFTGRIKCIFIDPPYNTGSAFAHYDDGLEHSLWLTMMRDRLEILKRLMAINGTIWVSLDGNEAHYLKVLCDEIFGRSNYLGDLIWKKRKGGGNDSYFFASDHDYIIGFAKNSDRKIHSQKWRVTQSEEYLKRYKEIDESGKRYYWDTLARDGLQNPILLKIQAPDGTMVTLNSQKSEYTVISEIESGTIRFSKGKNGWTLHHRVYMPEGQVLRSILDDSGTNKDSSDEMATIFGDRKAFDYPKPERLISKILELTTESNDLVLDSFAGSGTTGAVAHKMGRKWIMVELGDHCHTHIQPRLKKVCDGTDQGGISKAVNWQGGGGFKYYYMAPSLLKKDRYDQWVINEEYNPTMLAAAMAKHESFRYCPDEVYYWKQGQSSEKDFIFTTTAHLTPEHLDRIHEEMQPDDSLLICCKSHFEGADGRYGNITVKKIPSMLLGKCEFGRDDYSLNIVDMPRNPDDPEFVPTGPKVEEKKEDKASKAEKAGQLNIFAGTGE